MRTVTYSIPDEVEGRYSEVDLRILASFKSNKIRLSMRPLSNPATPAQTTPDEVFQAVYPFGLGFATPRSNDYRAESSRSQ